MLPTRHSPDIALATQERLDGRRAIQDQSKSLLDLHLAAVRTAVAQERERCAAICDLAMKEAHYIQSSTAMAALIAAEIRKDPA